MAKILVVDDEVRIATLCQSILERFGHEVRVATTPQMFLDMIPKEKFDVLVTDLKMPDINGFQCCEAALKLNPKMGVIIMTGLLTIDSKEEEKAKSFAHRLIRKPFSIKDLQEAVQSFMEKRSCHPRLSLQKLCY